MKGIKECVNWLMDNEGCVLKPSKGDACVVYVEGQFYHCDEKGSPNSNVTEFYRFGYFEWEEIKQPYTFEAAYKMCKEEGIGFENRFGDSIYRASVRNIVEIGITDADKYTELECEWYKL